MNPILIRTILAVAGGAMTAVGQIPGLNPTWASILTGLGGMLAGSQMFPRVGDTKAPIVIPEVK